MEQQPRYVEDGAGAEEEEERDAANGAPPAVTKWTWMALAAAGVAAAGGLILAYCLYRRIRRLEMQLNAMAAKQNNVALKVEKAAKDVATASTQVSAVQERLVNTQRFIVEMAQRQRWPWPFNNRIRGLEEEFGLPKK